MRATPLALLLITLSSFSACQKSADGTELGSRSTLSPRTLAMEFGSDRELLLSQTLDHEVGTWDAPKWPKAWLGVDSLKDGGEEEAGQRLQDGRRHFEEMCVQCHGISGRADTHLATDSGTGDTRPYKEDATLPRDFSLGFTKYKSTLGQALPTRQDLQTFLGRPRELRPTDGCTTVIQEDNPVIDYLEYLLMRHSLENRVAAMLNQIGAFRKSQDSVEQELHVLDAMTVAIPAVYESSFRAHDLETADYGDVDRGRQLYSSPAGQCASCHGMDGKGRGIAAWEPSLSKYVLKDMWGNVARPADFTTPPFRGGSTDGDITRAIAFGVGGTPMVSYGTTLNSLQIADLLAYIETFAVDPSPSAQSQPR